MSRDKVLYKSTDILLLLYFNGVGNEHIWIREKMLDLSSMVLPAATLKNEKFLLHKNDIGRRK